tara:strand:- start:396 stop:542 length:147 start_codon:yes stop_codon:yes gene_type:complete
MAKNKPHFLPSGKAYTGPTHKTNGKLMTGAKHTKTSKNLSHSKKGTKT